MTNKNLTFNTLDSYFLNTGNMRLNIGYFRDCIMDQFDIVQRFYSFPCMGGIRGNDKRLY